MFWRPRYENSLYYALLYWISDKLLMAPSGLETQLSNQLSSTGARGEETLACLRQVCRHLREDFK